VEQRLSVFFHRLYAKRVIQLVKDEVSEERGTTTATTTTIIGEQRLL